MLRKVKELDLLSVAQTVTGKARDFYLDDTDWAIHYAVVDAGPWILGRRAVVPSAALELPHW